MLSGRHTINSLMKLGSRNIVVMHVGFDYESKQIDEGRSRGDVGESFGAQVGLLREATVSLHCHIRRRSTNA